jgi:hypothetical protein
LTYIQLDEQSDGALTVISKSALGSKCVIAGRQHYMRGWAAKAKHLFSMGSRGRWNAECKNDAGLAEFFLGTGLDRR